MTTDLIPVRRDHVILAWRLAMVIQAALLDHAQPSLAREVAGIIGLLQSMIPEEEQ